MNSKIVVLIVACMTVLISVVAYELNVDQGLRSNDDNVREAALKSVLAQGPEAELGVPNDYFRAPLYDSDANVSISAINVLTHRKIADFNDDLMVLLVEGENTIRAAAAKALGVLSDKETATLPLWRSLSDLDESVRHQAIASIDILHKTRLGFYYDQDPEKYRIRARSALKEYLEIREDEVDSHAAKKYGSSDKTDK